MQGDSDALATALESAADAAEDSAVEQRRGASVARRVARDRRAHRGGGAPASVEAVASVLEVFGRSAQRMAAAVGGVRRAWAATLAEQGLSVRQIGQRLGVSHQRVSVLLTRHRNGSDGGVRS